MLNTITVLVFKGKAETEPAKENDSQAAKEIAIKDQMKE